MVRLNVGIDITYTFLPREKKMPTRLVLGSTARVKITTWFNGQLGLMTSHWRTSAITGLGCFDQDLATAYEAQVAGPLLVCLTNLSEYLGVSVKDISLLPLPASVTSNALAAFGIGGANPMPTQTAGLISWRTAIAGRKGRGRTYVPFPSLSNVTPPGESPNATYLTALSALATAMSTPLVVTSVGGTSTMQLFITPKINALGNAVTGFAVRSGWATQRRRGDLGRQNPPSIQL
jgi:hypothetical protein